jgi:hypothetical protein
MGTFSHLSTCVFTQSPKYLEMAQRHISLSIYKPPTGEEQVAQEEPHNEEYDLI